MQIGAWAVPGRREGGKETGLSRSRLCAWAASIKSDNKTHWCMAIPEQREGGKERGLSHSRLLIQYLGSRQYQDKETHWHKPKRVCFLPAPCLRCILRPYHHHRHPCAMAGDVLQQVWGAFGCDPSAVGSWIHDSCASHHWSFVRSVSSSFVCCIASISRFVIDKL